MRARRCDRSAGNACMRERKRHVQDYTCEDVPARWNGNNNLEERRYLMSRSRPLGEARDNVVPAGPPSTQPDLIDHHSRGILKNGRVFASRIHSVIDFSSVAVN